MLSGNLSYLALNSNPAISIGNNIAGAVVVDLKGFTIAGGGEIAGGNVSYGIIIGDYNAPGPYGNAYPITIRNGTLTDFTFVIDATLGGRGSLKNITCDHLTIAHPKLPLWQTTAINLSGAIASTVSYCNFSNYEFGIMQYGTANTANNSCRDLTFTSMTAPFYFIGGNPTNSTNPVVTVIPTANEHL